MSDYLCDICKAELEGPRSSEFFAESMVKNFEFYYYGWDDEKIIFMNNDMDRDQGIDCYCNKCFSNPMIYRYIDIKRNLTKFTNWLDYMKLRLPEIIEECKIWKR